MSLRKLFILSVLLSLYACDNSGWNNPYLAADHGKSILYAAFTERPKHLDPVQSYAEDEAVFTAQIYMPPLQYHYLKRPYELVPLAATEVPKPVFYDAKGRQLSNKTSMQNIAYSTYTIRIKPGIYYQPHPALAKDDKGNYLYHKLSANDLKNIFELRDFKQMGSRELIADDYVFQIKRLAHPHLHSPIFALMSEYIVGLKEYASKIKEVSKKQSKDSYLDLNQLDVAGVKVIDRYTYEIKVKGKYPQFTYWLAMMFFAPVPVEAEQFYSQPGMQEKNLTLDWYPIGTGAYMLTVNNPNRQMIMERNPNYQGEVYPSEGETEDKAAGLLQDAGKPLPLIDKVVLSLDKESIPRWNKFLQGYYDASGISSDNFDQTIQVTGGGEAVLTEAMQQQGITLRTSVATSIFYMGFNMLDSTVGGYSERNRKLRQAISIAIDQEEYIAIFANGRGIPAQGPIPPGIFGYVEDKTGINSYVYDWVNNKPQRKSIEAAKKLLAEAGYPNGIDTKTGQPLLIYLDTTLSGVDGKSRVDWLQKQFQKINVQFVVRNSDWNRFQEKIRTGTAQLFYFGWNADYPDPENFLFMLYGPESKVSKSGENAANYDNPEYNKLFEQMKNMDNGPERQIIINKMLAILRHDAPWVFGFHPKDYALAHAWMFNRKPNQMANNGLKYQRIDPALRERLRDEWNKPVLWPIFLILIFLIAAIVPAMISYRRREQNAILSNKK